MSNAYMNMARTTTCAALARRVLQAARLGSVSPSAYAFLSGSDANASQGLVDILNDGVREVLDDFPLINVMEDATLVTVPGQRHVLLPVTLRDADIMGLYWGDSEPRGYAGQPIDEISRAAVDRLHPIMRDGNYTSPFPEHYSISAFQVSGQAAINLYPVPDTARTMRLVYRAKETPFQALDIESVDAEATATLTGDSIASLTIANGGAGYSSAPEVVFGGSGIGALATATVSNGVVTGLAVTNGGTGYSTVTEPTFSVQINPSGGAILSIPVLTGGSGYVSAPTLVITGSGTGATATAIISQGEVTGITVTNGGTGYDSNTTVTFVGGGIAPTVLFVGGRTITTVPDALVEMLQYACAYRLAQMNTGTAGADWQGLRMRYEEIKLHWSYRLPTTPNAMRHMYLGRDGETRDFNNPFGAASLELEEYI